MNIAYLICGVVLLVAGRRLYWLFVAAVGFGAGALLAQEFFPGSGGADAQNSWMAFAIAILGGIAGAILAVLFQKLAVALAGAAAGGFFGWTLFEAMGAESFAWIGLIIGAVLGGILVLKLFDWGLIVVSSLAGAGFLIDGVQLEKSTEGWLLVAAFLFGLLVQGVQLARARRKKEAPPPPEKP
jgi:MFS family permease